MRLEQENDELARELITHRLSMEKQLDRVRELEKYAMVAYQSWRGQGGQIMCNI